MEKDRYTRLLRLATLASVATAITLIVAKLVAWFLTGSVSVLASLVDSFMDAAASIFNFVAVRYSLQPPDAEHRFGHGKAESLAGLAQATFITGSALFLVLESFDRILHPHPLEQFGAGVVVIGFSIVLTMMLLTLQQYVIRHTQSTAIRADALHYATDVLAGIAVIAALLLSHFLGWTAADTITAFAIALYILYSAWQIGRDAVQALIDRELPDEERIKIRGIALAHAGVHGVHDLRTRQAGPTKFIQLHLDLDAGETLDATHAIAEEVEAEIIAAFPNADVIIHQDPIFVDHSAVPNSKKN